MAENALNRLTSHSQHPLDTVKIPKKNNLKALESERKQAGFGGKTSKTSEEGTSTVLPVLSGFEPERPQAVCPPPPSQPRRLSGLKNQHIEPEATTAISE